MISQDSKRLLGTARTRQSIHHPHLVPARVVEDEQGRVRILLQRYEVPTLSEVLSSGPVPMLDCLRMLYGIASAVEALTAEGLVARDLNPDRILIRPRRGALLADPGIPLEVLPRGVEPDQASTFVSPEERAGLPIDRRSNVYSLGAVFIAAITAPDGERLPVPGAAKDVIARAMATEPEKRDLSPSEFIVALAISLGFRRKGEAPAPESPKQAETAPRPASGKQLSGATEPRRRTRTAKPKSPATPRPRPKRSPTRKPAATAPESVRPEPRPQSETSQPPAETTPTPRPRPAEPKSRPAQPRPKRRPTRKPAATAPESVRPEPRPESGTADPPAETTPTPPRPAKPKSRPAQPRPKRSPTRKPAGRASAPARPESRPQPTGSEAAVGTAAPQATPPRRPTPKPRPPRRSEPERASSRRRVPKPPRPRLPAVSLRAPRRISPAVASLAVALLACALGGIVLGSSLRSDPTSTRVESAAFAVDLPKDWGETGVVRTPWVELSAPVAAAPFGETGVGFVAGEVPDLTTVDRRFRVEGERTAVRLGRLEAWRYAGLRPREGLAATAYLAPTTGAPLLVVCHARVRAASARLRQCEEIASTIALKGQEPGSLARVGRYEQQVAGVIGSLRRERVQARRRLADAKRASGQARAARSLEREYRVAVKRLRSIDAPPGTPIGDDLLGPLRAAASAYGRLAAAAAHANKVQYRAASEAVVHREEAVQREAAA